MASNGQRTPRTTTSTTTTTTFSVSQNRLPRSSNPGHAPSSSSSSRHALIARTHDGVPTPRASNIDNSTEQFPALERPQFTHLSPQISRVRTEEPFPISNIALTSVGSNVSAQRQAASGVASRVRLRPIGIKRLSSQNLKPELSRTNTAQTTSANSTSGRRRSTSAPQRPTLLDEDGAPLQHAFTATNHLPALYEGQATSAYHRPDDPESGNLSHAQTTAANAPSRSGSQRLRRASDAARSVVSRMSNRSDEPQDRVEYDEGIVDILDVLDPEVSTLTTLTNVQNSLFVPDLGRWLNRRPTFELTKGPSYRSQRPTLNRGYSKPLPPSPTPGSQPIRETEVNIPSDIDEEATPSRERRYSLASVQSITSVVQDKHYAVLPHGVSLDGWSEEDKELLDDHVRHMLHSKREGFKRSMRAFGKYVRKPLGFFVTLYAVLITLFGLAWVLFLIGWIYVGEKQLYVINVIDNVLVALFAIMGDGLAPFRAVDTYHMSFIAYYHHLTRKLRKKRELPKLQDHNELPDIHENDVEATIVKDDTELSVLTQEQQRKLEHHQRKFAKSHSFYKPHETSTHHAFLHHYFVAIVLLLDLHSCLQITLGACTWGTNYMTRPKALTPTILSCSITVNITAGILIKIGDSKTRKKDVLTRMFRQELTEEAMRRVEQQKEQDENDERFARLLKRRERDIKEEKEDGDDVVKIREGRDSDGNRFSSASIEADEAPRKIN